MSEIKVSETDPRHVKMLAALARGMTWEEAAENVGVSERTLRRWCQSDPDLAEAAAEARSRADDMVEAVAFNNCLDPDPSHNTLRMFWLKCRRPAVYRDKSEVKLDGDSRIVVEYRDAAPLAALPSPEPIDVESAPPVGCPALDDNGPLPLPRRKPYCPDLDD